MRLYDCICGRVTPHPGLCELCRRSLSDSLYVQSRAAQPQLLETDDEYALRMEKLEAMSGGHPDDHGNN